MLYTRFKALVEEHFEEHRSLQAYADLMQISAKHLGETVKQCTGQSALYCIHERIIHEAEYLLVHTFLSVKEIAFALSFEDASHFTRFFKKYKQTTPREFRNHYT